MSNTSMIDGHIDEPKGMSDEDIIKIAKNCCSDMPNCVACPLEIDTITADQCMGKLLDMCLNLINRQKAEIEKLKTRNDELNTLNKTTAQEAIKEFAERLKTETFLAKAKGSVEHIIWMSEIDNLVKEMVGD